jgi:cardiolipin hydrolase
MVVVAEVAKSWDRDVAIRLITDFRGYHGEQEGGDWICQKLQRAGVEIRRNPTSDPGYMHHKFVIIDNSILMNGSLNFTRQAIMMNFENMAVTSNVKLIATYKQQFEALWQEFGTQQRG